MPSVAPEIVEAPAQPAGARGSRVVVVFLSLAALAFFFTVPAAGALLRFGIAAPLVLCLLASAGAAAADRWRLFAALALVAGLLLLLLRWLWYTGPSDTMLLGGFLPFSDASDYVVNAQQLVGGGRIQGQGHGNDHLMASAMLAVLLKGLSGDYRLVLVAISLLDAASIFLAAVEVVSLAGILPGAVWLLVDFLFLRRFIGLPMSEHLGIAFANLGLGLGCRAVRLNRDGLWVWAAFALAMALRARPGALFMIPLIVVGGYLASRPGRTGRWRLPAAMAAAAALAIVLDKLVTYFVGNRSAAAGISNAVYPLHSLVFGGTWTDAMNLYGNDRPAVWHAVEEQLRAHPFSIVAGGWRSIEAIVRGGYLFTFAGSRWVSLLLHFLFAAGSVASLVALKRDRRAWYLVAVLAGILFSMPFLPPWNTDNMRVYAASIPALGFTASIGLSVLLPRRRLLGLELSKATRGRPEGAADGPSPGADALGAYGLFGTLGLLAALAVFLPPLFRPHDLAPTWTIEDTYRTNQTNASIPYSPGVCLKIVPDASPRRTLALRLADFKSGLSGFARLYPGEAALLGRLPDSCTILPTSHEFSFIVIDQSHIPPGNRPQDIRFQARFLAEGWLLVAVDETILERSKALAAYATSPVGPFSFGINRYPVIRSGDVVTLVENVQSVELLEPRPAGPNVSSIKPYQDGSRRLRFPVAGEYYLRVNGRYPIKLLVLDPDTSETEAGRRILSFVESNSKLTSEPAEPAPRSGESVDAARFFESAEAPALSRGQRLHFATLLRQTFLGAGT